MVLLWLTSWFGEYIAKSRFAVRREELVDELDEEVAELVAKRVAESGEEVGRDGGVVVSFHGSCFYWLISSCLWRQRSG